MSNYTGRSCYLNEIRMDHFNEDFEKYLKYQEELAYSDVFKNYALIKSEKGSGFISSALGTIFMNTISSASNRSDGVIDTPMFDACVAYIESHQINIDYKVFFESLFSFSTEFLSLDTMFSHENADFVLNRLFKTLIERAGFDLDNSLDSKGRNILVMLVSKKMPISGVEYVLGFGANPNAIVNGKYAFQHYSPVNFNYFEALMLFSRHGAELTIENGFEPCEDDARFIGPVKVKSMLDITDKLIASIEHGYDGSNLQGAYIDVLTRGKELLMRLALSDGASKQISSLVHNERRKLAI